MTKLHGGLSAGYAVRVVGTGDSLEEQMRRAREAATAAAQTMMRAAEAQARSAEMLAQAMTVVRKTGLPADKGLRPIVATGQTGADVPESWSGIVTLARLGALRRAITQVARKAGLAGEPLSHFVLAAQELMTNALRHGGGWGRVRLRRDGNHLTCTVIDHGPGLAGDVSHYGESPLERPQGGRGLFLARRLTGNLHMDSRRFRTLITVTMDLSGSTSPDFGPGAS